MSDQEPQAPDEQTQEEIDNLPAPSDPENPEHAPLDPEADEVGPSDDEVTGGEQGDGTAGVEAPDAEAPAAPAVPDTESRLDEITRALAKAEKAYIKRVTEAFGEDWHGCQPCPLCAEHFAGVITPAPPSEEAIAAVKPLIGLPDLSTYREDRFARPCDRCGGLGKTLTGSKVPKFATMTCNDCKGTGFQTAEEGIVQPATNGHSVIEPAPTHTDDEPVAAMPEAAMVALEEMLAAARNRTVA